MVSDHTDLTGEVYIIIGTIDNVKFMMNKNQ